MAYSNGSSPRKGKMKDWLNPKSMVTGAVVLVGAMLVPSVELAVGKIVNKIQSVFHIQ